MLRRMLKLSGWTGVLVLSAAAVSACAQASPEASPPATPTASAASSERPCKQERNLTPQYVPRGWTADLKGGPGGGGTDPAAVGHWSGGSGEFVQVTRGRMYELSEPGRPLMVLGQVARGGQIHEGFGADFRMCDTDYQLQGYGVDEAAFYRLGESLSLTG